MLSTDALERFIACVECNAHVEAIETFYAPDASMCENQAPARVGRELLAGHERRALSRARSVRSACVRPQPANATPSPAPEAVTEPSKVQEKFNKLLGK